MRLESVQSVCVQKKARQQCKWGLSSSRYGSVNEKAVKQNGMTTYTETFRKLYWDVYMQIVLKQVRQK